MVPLAMKTRKDPKIHLVPPFPNYQNTKIPQIHGSFTMKNNNTMFRGQVWEVLPFFCWKPMSAGMPCRSYFLYIPRVQPLFSLPPVTSQSRPPPSPSGTTVMASPATPGPCNPSSTQEPEQFRMCANLVILFPCPNAFQGAPLRKRETSWRTHLQNGYLINDLGLEYV